MHRLIRTIFILTPFFLASCLDIVEEIDLKNDMSGKATYIFNLSQSKTKLNAALNLDSIGDYKIPKGYEIEREINKAVSELTSKEGITHASYTINESEYIYTLIVQFRSLNFLNAAIQEMSYWKKSEWKPTKEFYSEANGVISKRGEKIAVPENRKSDLNKQRENLELGNYIFILRSFNYLEAISPSVLKLSGNKKAVMYKANLYNLINNEEELNLKIAVK
jgi:hypothetical protein